jgi:hypothetical protein
MEGMTNENEWKARERKRNRRREQGEEQKEEISEAQGKEWLEEQKKDKDENKERNKERTGRWIEIGTGGGEMGEDEGRYTKEKTDSGTEEQSDNLVMRNRKIN